MFRSIRSRLPRIGRWPRLLLAGACLLLALNSALGAKQVVAQSPRTVAVVVATRDLPAGHSLTRHDVAVARWPAALRPATARGDPALVIGERLAGPIVAREAITVARVVGADLADGLGRGRVATPVSLGNPHTVDLVRAGDRIDLLETARPPEIADPGLAVDPKVDTLASGALVLAVWPATDGADAELVVAVGRATAVRITRDTATHVFTAVVDPP